MTEPVNRSKGANQSTNQPTHCSAFSASPYEVESNLIEFNVSTHALQKEMFQKFFTKLNQSADEFMSPSVERSDSFDPQKHFLISYQSHVENAFQKADKMTQVGKRSQTVIAHPHNWRSCPEW